MGNESRPPRSSILEKRWLLIPVIFTVWTISVVAVVRGFSKQIPQLEQIGFGMTLEDLKGLIRQVSIHAEEHYTAVAGFLAFLFL